MTWHRSGFSFGKPWPFLSLHYCGWDKDCQVGQGTWTFSDGTVYEQGRLRRINIGIYRFFWYIDVVHWNDRGSYHRTPEDYRRLRRGESR